MTAVTTSASWHRVSTPASTAYAGLITLGRHVSLYTVTVLTLPQALVRYRKHTFGQIGEVTFGTSSLLSGGGTIGIVFAMSLAAAMMLEHVQRGDLAARSAASRAARSSAKCARVKGVRLPKLGMLVRMSKNHTALVLPVSFASPLRKNSTEVFTPE